MAQLKLCPFKESSSFAGWEVVPLQGTEVSSPAGKSCLDTKAGRRAGRRAERTRPQGTGHGPQRTVQRSAFSVQRSGKADAVQRSGMPFSAQELRSSGFLGFGA